MPIPVPASFTGRYLSWGANSPLLNHSNPGILTKAGRALFVMPLILIGPCGALYNIAQTVKYKAVTLLTDNPKTKSTYTMLTQKSRTMACLDIEGFKAGAGLPIKIIVITRVVCSTLLAAICATAAVVALVYCQVIMVPIWLALGVVFGAVPYSFMKEVKCNNLHDDFINEPSSFYKYFLSETKWYYQDLLNCNLVVAPPLTDKEITQFDLCFQKANAHMRHNPVEAILNGIRILLDMGKIAPNEENEIRDILHERIGVEYGNAHWNLNRQAKIDLAVEFRREVVP